MRCAQQWVYSPLYALKPWAAIYLLTSPKHHGFDILRAAWQPTTRFAPAEINPVYTDPEYADQMTAEDLEFVENEKRFLARRAARKAQAAGVPCGGADANAV